MKVIRAYQSLSPRQQQVVRTKQVDIKAVPGRALDLLRSVGEFDRVSDESRGDLVKLGAILFGVGFACIFVASYFYSVIYVSMGFFSLSAVAFFLYFFFRKRDLPNTMRLFVLPLVAVLREDMEDKERLSLKVDLRGAKEKSKLQSKERKRTRNLAIHKLVESIYVDPWLQGSARLADGILIHWKIIDTLRHRDITKRGSSGKLKFKTKSKVKRLYEVQLTVPKKRYALEEGDAWDGDNVKVNHKDSKSTVRVRRVEVSRTTGRPAELRPFLQMIASVYKQVKPVERSA